MSGLEECLPEKCMSLTWIAVSLLMHPCVYTFLMRRSPQKCLSRLLPLLQTNGNGVQEVVGITRRGLFGNWEGAGKCSVCISCFAAVGAWLRCEVMCESWQRDLLYSRKDPGAGFDLAWPWVSSHSLLPIEQVSLEGYQGHSWREQGNVPFARFFMQKHS